MAFFWALCFSNVAFHVKALGMGYFLNRSLSYEPIRPSRNPSLYVWFLDVWWRSHFPVDFLWEALQSEAGIKPSLYKPSVLCDAACLHMVVLV